MSPFLVWLIITFKRIDEKDDKEDNSSYLGDVQITSHLLIAHHRFLRGVHMKILRIMLPLLPIPFLFHFYEYNSHLARQEPVFLFPGFLLFIIIVGIQLKEFKLRWIFLLGIFMTIVSSLLSYFFLSDDGGWFKPFGRDTVVLGTSVIYVLGQIIVRSISRRKTPGK